MRGLAPPGVGGSVYLVTVRGEVSNGAVTVEVVDLLAGEFAAGRAAVSARTA